MNIIAAMTEKRVIGKAGVIPWHISEDLKLFKRLTIGNTVIMGRQTYESIGHPLPKRNNIVISKNFSETEEITVCRTFEESLKAAEKNKNEIYIIGGESIYKQALKYTDKMYISYVKGDYNGDTFFPVFNKDNWSVIESALYNDFTLIVYQRKQISNR